MNSIDRIVWIPKSWWLLCWIRFIHSRELSFRWDGTLYILLLLEQTILSNMTQDVIPAIVRNLSLFAFWALLILFINKVLPTTCWHLLNYFLKPGVSLELAQHSPRMVLAFHKPPWLVQPPHTQQTPLSMWRRLIRFNFIVISVVLIHNATSYDTQQRIRRTTLYILSLQSECTY